MVNKFSFMCAVLFLSTFAYTKVQYRRADVNVVGYIKLANGLGRHAIAWLDALSPHLTAKFIDTRPSFSSLQDVPEKVKQIALKKDTLPSANVSLLTDNIWLPGNRRFYTHMPPATIKLAYSVCESTKAPKPWVDALNKHFDAVIVADDFLVEVYKTSGVKIPIFVLPLALYLDGFLQVPLKQSAHKPFVFGVSAALSRNKNIGLLIEAFAAEFGNSPDVLLTIHSPWQGNLKELEATIKMLNLHNINIQVGELSLQEYINFMRGIDCYALVSRGEGFSITVREAMALGTPCIISDNTAHRTICKTGLVYAVPSLLRQPSDREFYQVDVGDNFNCRLQDVRRALREVYEQYPQHLELAAQRRAWAARYDIRNIAPLYGTIIKPLDIRIGQENSITKDYLMTTSKRLLKKFKSLTRNEP